jgi:hypothetical protein
MTDAHFCDSCPGYIGIVLLAVARATALQRFTPAMLPPTIRLAGLRRLLARHRTALRFVG